LENFRKKMPKRELSNNLESQYFDQF